MRLDDIRGSPKDSYKMLPKFAYILELNNLGSVVKYKVDVDGRFLYFFMALYAFISGWQYCRPVISIDGTSLKNKYSGTLLSASTPNTNDQIFPLAFCVVDFENDFSWTWFCNQLKRIIGGRNEVVIVSDRHKSICKAIEVRELPICSMFEILRIMLQRWFFERREVADYQVTDFTKTIEVNPVNNMKYEVIDGTSQYVIYLPTKVCSCKM
ncbi:protein FAR-RED ELONGATED HYPOCOTYL 3-like [Cucumis melo var. makuwa]|uniref:Protein FAR-RED ELONGATED HYPOCOTYL 3-like n=1 Tax=Cucumis melo var. makuwa TaxID=1194695 RepID=A0A5A7SWF3_CUCMM|nr:protein FAR-RED ELONGATED HYPOCOTYL 3-like [Cucumis melo var. makuwa]